MVMPEPPTDVRCRYVSDDQIRLSWDAKNLGEVAYMIFGSDRKDFVPDVYSACQITKMKDKKTTATEPNENYVVSTRATHITLPYEFYFYRIVARLGNALSTPSALVNALDRLGKTSSKNTPALILQQRARGGKGRGGPGYWAEVMALPDPPAPYRDRELRKIALDTERAVFIDLNGAAARGKNPESGANGFAFYREFPDLAPGVTFLQGGVPFRLPAYIPLAGVAAEVAFRYGWRTLYTRRWQNPEPDTKVKAIKAVAVGDAISILIAVTGERP